MKELRPAADGVLGVVKTTYTRLEKQQTLITPSAAGLNSFILAYFYYMEKKFDVPGILHLESKVWYICRWSVMKFLILEWWPPPAQWPEVFGQIPL